MRLTYRFLRLITSNLLFFPTLLFYIFYTRSESNISIAQTTIQTVKEKNSQNSDEPLELICSENRVLLEAENRVLLEADEELIQMLEELGGTTVTSSRDVAEIAQRNQAISNTRSAASQVLRQANQTLTWREFTSTEGRFSVLMPGTPTEQVQESGNNSDEFRQFSLTVQGGILSYGVMYKDLSKVPSQLSTNKIQALLNFFRDRWLKEGQLRSERNIALGEYPGREIEIETSGGFISKIRLYWVQGRLYQIIFAVATEEDFIQESDKFLESFKLLKNGQEQKAEAEHFLQEGLQLVNIGQPQAALEKLHQAQKIFQAIRNRYGEGASLLIKGRAYEALSQYPKALEAYEEAEEIFKEKEVDDKSAQGITLNNIGVIYRDLSKYSDALKYFEQARTIFENRKDQARLGDTHNNMGGVYLILGRYPEALKSLSQALDIFQQLEDNGQDITLANDIKARKATVLNELGVLYDYLGQDWKALKYYQQSLEVFLEVHDLIKVGNAFINIGGIYEIQKQDFQAQSCYKEALAIFQETNHLKGVALAFNNLGGLSLNQNRHEVARSFYNKALEIHRQIRDRNGEAITLNNIGVAYAQEGRYEQALSHYHKALVIRRRVDNKLGEGITLSNMGETFFQSGKLPEAREKLEEAIKVLKPLRKELGDLDKISILETQIGDYLTLQRVLIAQNKNEVALTVAEEGRAQAFVELLSLRLSTNLTNQPELSQRPTIEQIKQSARNQKATLVEYSILYDDKLQESSLSRESELFIWVVKPTGEVTFRQVKLPQTTSLQQLVTNTRKSLGVRGRNSIEIVPDDGIESDTQLKELHKILIEPIADLLPSDVNDKVIFMPQGELFLVPFPALQDENGKYLIEKHTILTAPAIQVLDLTQQQRAKVQQANTQGLVIVGNPTMPKVTVKIGEPPERLEPLPAAEQEAISIANLLKTKALTGKEATKNTILTQLPQAKIIHLATHGLLDDFQGLGVPGAIALAPSGNDNGLLTASEILDLKLNAELVVLSACDTGRGRITGDGVIGLSRSLITAGVPSVIVSLWSVPDAPTASLMTEFYRNWQEKKLDKAQALRQAMLTTMKTHPNPKNWAAFTLIGEAE